MIDIAGRPPRAVVFGCKTLELGAEEREFFTKSDPLGFNLFKRNCESPDQVRALIADLRACVGRADAPIFIDQEGGRVARLQPPHWRKAPAAKVFGDLAARDLGRAIEAVTINHRLFADELRALGVSVVFAPVLDVVRPETTNAIGDRAFSADPVTTGILGLAACTGLLAGGILPVIKHMPGHGRAVVDSHVVLPVIDAAHAELARHDFVPFAMNAGAGWGMTAHLCYRDLDADRPATQSPHVIEQIIRGEIGFAGVLISDDICMEALDGDAGQRAAASVAAGCDVALHGNGTLEEKALVADAVGPLSASALARMARAERMCAAPVEIDAAAFAAQLERLLSEA